MGGGIRAFCVGAGVWVAMFSGSAKGAVGHAFKKMASSSRGVFGGERAPNRYPAVTYLQSTKGSWCSTTLIGGRVAMSAGHCFPKGAKEGTATLWFKGKEHKARCEVHPDYATNDAADFVLCELDRSPRGIDPICIGPELAPGATAKLVGYGRTENGSTWDQHNGNVVMAHHSSGNLSISTQVSRTAGGGGDSGGLLGEVVGDRMVASGVMVRSGIYEPIFERVSNGTWRATGTYKIRAQGSTTSVNLHAPAVLDFMQSFEARRKVSICGLARHGKLGVTLAEQQAPEIRIGEVTPGSAAATEGIRSGDVLVSFNGRAVTSPDAIYELVRAAKAKGLSEWRVKIRDRRGRERTVTFDTRAKGSSFVMGLVPTQSYASKVSASAVARGMPAARGGLKNGETIVSVNGRPMRSSAEVIEAVRRAKAGTAKSLTLLVAKADTGSTREIEIPLQ